MRFRKKPVEIEAVQLRWDTWSEMCEHADVGMLGDGKPQGGYWYSAAPDEPAAFHFKPSIKGDENTPSVFPDDALAMAIPTLEGLMVAVEGDWVIRGVAGELYPCKPEIFEETYEPVEKAE